MLTVEQLIACGLDKAEASEITKAVNRILKTQSPAACWHEISRHILTHITHSHSTNCFMKRYIPTLIAQQTSQPPHGFLQIKISPKQISPV